MPAGLFVWEDYTNSVRLVPFDECDVLSFAISEQIVHETCISIFLLCSANFEHDLLYNRAERFRNFGYTV